MKLFVYGTLKKGFGNHRVLGDSDFLGETTLEIPFKMLDLGAFPGLIPSKKLHTIHGELYELIDPEVVKAVDFLEGHPDFYNKTEFDGVTFYYLDNAIGYSNCPVIESGKW